MYLEENGYIIFSSNIGSYIKSNFNYLSENNFRDKILKKENGAYEITLHKEIGKYLTENFRYRIIPTIKLVGLIVSDFISEEQIEYNKLRELEQKRHEETLFQNKCQHTTELTANKQALEVQLERQKELHEVEIKTINNNNTEVVSKMNDQLNQANEQFKKQLTFSKAVAWAAIVATLISAFMAGVSIYFYCQNINSSNDSNRELVRAINKISVSMNINKKPKKAGLNETKNKEVKLKKL